MFGFGVASARTKRVDAALTALAPAMELLTGGEKAAVLLLVCVQSAMLSEVYAPGLPAEPARFPDDAMAGVDGLLEMLEVAESSIAQAPMTMARYMRVHSTSLLILLATIAAGLPATSLEHARARTRASLAWKDVWAARASVEPALSWLRRGEAASGLPCFPRLQDRRVSDLDILAMIKLPAFLVRRSKAKTKSGGIA